MGKAERIETELQAWQRMKAELRRRHGLPEPEDTEAWAKIDAELREEARRITRLPGYEDDIAFAEALQHWPEDDQP